MVIFYFLFFGIGNKRSDKLLAGTVESRGGRRVSHGEWKSVGWLIFHRIRRTGSERIRRERWEAAGRWAFPLPRRSPSRPPLAQELPSLISQSESAGEEARYNRAQADGRFRCIERRSNAWSRSIRMVLRWSVVADFFSAEDTPEVPDNVIYFLVPPLDPRPSDSFVERIAPNRFVWLLAFAHPLFSSIRYRACMPPVITSSLTDRLSPRSLLTLLWTDLCSSSLGFGGDENKGKPRIPL